MNFEDFNFFLVDWLYAMGEFVWIFMLIVALLGIGFGLFVGRKERRSDKKE